eukprot:TRINITY_DN18546_c0_g1::TRINITY_DN18546_c0_g1_i1::g.1142::m.1142 TRINITY_DN18546_c0_g1::TRINITY_DN18546_c0_g1_i1::g.1142  ORF type:complete len:112 (+),score=12.89,DUF4611/PF15387.1/0.0061,RXT2_N/PF08595.6/0.048 TRINITY_DN18546_c0_g1_i1:46-381(+)
MCGFLNLEGYRESLRQRVPRELREHVLADDDADVGDEGDEDDEDDDETLQPHHLADLTGVYHPVTQRMGIAAIGQTPNHVRCVEYSPDRCHLAAVSLAIYQEVVRWQRTED